MARHWRSFSPLLAGSFGAAKRAGRIAKVGMVSQYGEVLLNYVSPDARFQAVSKAHLEAEAWANGCEFRTFVSTRTVERFYRGEGYVEKGRTSDDHMRLHKQVPS